MLHYHTLSVNSYSQGTLYWVMKRARIPIIIFCFRSQILELLKLNVAPVAILQVLKSLK